MTKEIKYYNALASLESVHTVKVITHPINISQNILQSFPYKNISL